MAKHTLSSEFAGATPLPATFNIEAPARGKKIARVMAATSVAAEAEVDDAPDYAALGIPVEAVPVLEAARVRVAALGRLETSHVYVCGAAIHEVREAAPDQATFAKWSKTVFNLSRRGAENFVAVHRVLSPYRSRVEQLRLKPSTLYLMASAKPERIDELLSLQETGRLLSVKQVKAILRERDGEAVEKQSVSSGGVAGLKSRIAEKTACGVAAMMNTAFEILKAIHIALEPHRKGRRVRKDETMRPLIMPARLLREQLESMIWLAQPAGKGFQEGIVHVRPLNREDDWYRLWEMLEDLGGYESWPKAADIGTWLSDAVVPQLEWLVGDRAPKAAAVIDEMAKASAAERAKSEKKSRTKEVVAKAGRGTKATKQVSVKAMAAGDVIVTPTADVRTTST